MAKDTKGHGSEKKGAAYSREMGRAAGAAGKSLKGLMRSHGVMPGTKTAQAMSAGHLEGRNTRDASKPINKRGDTFKPRARYRDED